MDRNAQSPGPSRAPSRWRTASIVGACVGIAALSVAVVGIWLRGERRKAVQAWEGRLSAMADDREAAVETWIRERRGDARMVASYPSVRALLRPSGDPLQVAGGEAGKAHLAGIFRELAGAYDYDGVYLLDGDDRLVVSSPGAPELGPDVLAPAVAQGAAPPDHVLFFPGASLNTTLAVFVEEVRSASGGAPSRPEGRIVMTISPARRLFRRLTREPFSTATGETLLVQRRGDAVVFVSPLRFKRPGPLPPSIPLATPRLAARHAVEGRREFGEFDDYRGAKVLAAVRPIEGSDLGLIAKVDVAEALDPFRREATLQLFTLLAVLSAAALLIRGLWRRGQVRSLEALLEERRRSESRILQLNRLLRTISEVNQLVVREADRDKLLEEACRILVDHGQFVMAWVGFAGADGRVEIPVARAGLASDYVESITIRWDDSPEGRGPSGTAIREGRHVVNADVTTNPAMTPWREAALRAGYRCSAAFPLRVGGKPVGAVAVYEAEAGAIGDEEVTLLDEMAGNLGFALEALENREERSRAEEETRALNAELEDRVRRRTAELEAANGELEAFTFSVSHDLRAPVRAVDGFAGMLEQRYGGVLDEEGRRLLGTVRRNAQRMGLLIEDLLTFSRTSRVEPKRVPIDMKLIVGEVVAELAPAGRPDRPEVRVGELPRAVGDPGLVRQVWQNLVSNALKFSAGKPHPVIEIGFEGGPEGRGYFVRDNGAGFDPKYAGKLFGVFQRLHGITEFEGTGVGLALVRRVVERHGGRVHGEGELGRGATFSFTLGPAAPPAGERGISA